MSQCPKCGAERREFDSYRIIIWLCGSEKLLSQDTDDEPGIKQSRLCRISELERQVARLTVERDAFSGTACANGQLDGGGRCGICVRCKAHENAALRAVLRELPCRLSVRYGRPALADMLADIAAACRERCVKLEGEK